ESQQEYTAHFGKQTVKIVGNKSEEHIEEVVRRVNIALNEIKSKPSILSNQKMALLVAVNATSHWLESEAEIASQREQIGRLSRQKA
ncbi:cell division protein ZapA, partial [Streptococcus oralis]|uniref:cell division protein ZapA n=1 Tax=Streptococcus oralis TaxID=1303 RepID=UPI0025579168